MNGYMKPQDIEKRSFEIITEELGARTFPVGIAEVVKRVIHTTADFDYADLAVGLAEVVLGLRQSVRFIDGNTSEIGGTQSISNSHVLELLRRKVEQTAAPRHIL